jgi:hypothetical protein
MDQSDRWLVLELLPSSPFRFRHFLPVFMSPERDAYEEQGLLLAPFRTNNLDSQRISM